ncbi:MAG: urease accessory protein UreD [Rhodospirillales bacterium]
MQGAVALTFRADGGQTRLADLHQRAPLRALFPDEPATGIPTAVLLTTSGGMVGGDGFTVAVNAGETARACVTTQAAEKIYRSLGADVRIDVSLRAAADAWLEWMPQETILFDASRLSRTTTVDLAPGARLLAGEILVFGRIARGERFRQGRLRDTWRISRAGRLLWHDALALEDDIPRLIDARAGFAGAAAAATVLYAGDDDPERHLPPLRALIAFDAVRSAATCVNGVLVVRGLAEDARRLRDWLMRVWRSARAELAALPPVLPRVWLT